MAFIVAVTVVAKVGDFERFDNPRQVMAYLGLTPSDYSRGASVRWPTGAERKSVELPHAGKRQPQTP